MAAANDPTKHFALAGASTKAKQRNFVGVVLREDHAARLGGILARLVVAAGGGSQAQVAWIGPGPLP